MTTKIYSMDVALYATAYIKAESPEEARERLLEQLMDATIEVPDNAPNGFICSWDYERLLACEEQAFDVTLSPAMTPDHVLNDGMVQLVWPEPEEEHLQ